MDGATPIKTFADALWRGLTPVRRFARLQQHGGNIFHQGERCALSRHTFQHDREGDPPASH